MSYFSNIALIIADKLNPLIDRLNFLSTEVISNKSLTTQLVNQSMSSLISTYKLVDQTITNDDNLINDDDLTLSPQLSTIEKTYSFEMVLIVEGHQNADSIFQITDVNSTSAYLNYTYPTGVNTWENRYAAYNFNDIIQINLDTWGNINRHIIVAKGVLVIPPNQNTVLQLRWAQNRNKNSDLTVKKGSFMKLYPLN